MPPVAQSTHTGSSLPRGRINLKAFEELQVAVGEQPLILTLTKGDAHVFGEVLAVGETYVFMPNSLTSVATLTGAEISVLGNPHCADVNSNNKHVVCQVLNITTSLNRIRFQAFGAMRDESSVSAESDSVGPVVLLVGDARAGKSTMAHTINLYSQRSGWRPTLFSLNPSGVSALTLKPPVGCVTAEVADRLMNPSSVDSLIRKCDVSASSEKFDVLREWYDNFFASKAANSESVNQPRATQTKGGNRRGMDVRMRVMTILSSIARKEAVEMGDEVKSDRLAAASNSPESTAETIPATLCTWERLTRPLISVVEPLALQEDTIAVWSGCKEVQTPEEQVLWLQAVETLSELAKMTFWTPNGASASGSSDLYRASGAIVDCPPMLPAELIVKVAKIFNADLILTLEDTATHAELVDLFSQQELYHVQLAVVPAYRCDVVPPDLMTYITQAEASRATMETILIPRLNLNDLDAFILNTPSSPINLPNGIALPLPARLLRTPLSLTLGLTITVPTSALHHLTLLKVSPNANPYSSTQTVEAITVDIEAIKATSPVPGALLRSAILTQPANSPPTAANLPTTKAIAPGNLPSSPGNTHNDLINRRVLTRSLSVSSPLFLWRKGSGIMIHVREAEVNGLKNAARGLALCVMDNC